jgi:hypothetical protein
VAGRLSKFWLFLLIGLILFGAVVNGAAPASAQTTSGSRLVVLVDCDYLQIGDLGSSDLPHLHSFINNGSIALLNTNTAGDRNRPNAAVTLGAGRVAVGTTKETLVYGSDEDTADHSIAQFQARTGFVPKPSNLFVMEIPTILRANETGDNKATPGTLGDSLHKAGLYTAALGNSDLTDLPQRSIAVAAMDGQGIIDYGDLSNKLLTFDQNFPGGLRTNYQQLQTSFLSIKDKAQFVVIDLGDLVRLEQNKPNLTDRVYHEDRQKILAQYDRFLGWLQGQLDANQSRVMVASLVPTPDELAMKRSMGLLAVQGEQITTGMLLSPTTRRPGIITLYDLAPSIANYLGAPADQNWIGRAWEMTPDSQNLVHLQSMETHIFLTSMMRPPMVEGYVALHLLVLGIMILLLCFRPKYVKYLNPFLLALVTVPMAWLLIGQLPFLQPWLYTIIFLALVATIVATSTFLARNNLDAILLLCTATVFILLVDTITGCILQKSALLGYDPMDGARFYGIGNEYMGVLVGAIIMGSALFIQRIRKYQKSALVIVAGLFILTVAVLGAPQWGSKFGGVLTTVVAFIYTFLRFNNLKIRWKHVLLAVLAVVAVGAAVLLRDFMRPPELRSHFGLLVTSIQSRGLVAFQEIISRKLSMNYRLIKYTIWTRVYLGSLLALGILFYRPVDILGRVLRRYPVVAAGLEGSLVAALAALVFNDSGIVAASTAIIFPAATLFYLVMKEKEGMFTGN